MPTTKKVVLLVGLFSLYFSPLARGTDVIANFDQFSEGVLGTQFTDGGIQFSELEVEALGGVPRFSAEDASANGWPHMSSPNYLSTFGYFPGPGGGVTQFRSFRIAPPSEARAAAVDMFLAIGLPELLGRRVTLTAYLGNGEVATTSVLTGQGTTIQPGFAEYHLLSITAPSFDSLKIAATDAMGNPSAALGAFDNVRITLVPEPSSVLLGLCGIPVVACFRRDFLVKKQ